jgi:hypothetical protein
MLQVVFLLGIASAGDPPVHPPPGYSTDAIIESLRSIEFSPGDFQELWWKYYDSRQEIRASESHKWAAEVDSILSAAVTTGSVASVRALLRLEYPDDLSRRPIFSPSRGLYKVVRSTDMEEADGARMARVLVENGAVPTMFADSKSSKYSRMTCIEIAVRNRRPLVVQALLQDPSPLNFAVLEEMSEKDHDARRGIEIYRSRIIRETIEAKRRAKLHGIISVRGGKGGRTNEESIAVEKIIAMLQEAHVFVFAERYLQSLAMLVVYLVFVFLLVHFLYDLRVKRVPVNSKLMIPISEGSGNSATLDAIAKGCACFASGLPTSNVFETLAGGLACIGSIVHCEIYTKRTDLSTAIVLTVLLQSMITLSCYYAYAPRVNDQQYAETEPLLYRIMFYPKGKDVSAAVMNGAMYVIASSLTFLVMFSVLTPLQAMYFCPGDAVSDTYGFEGSLTRVLTTVWDLLIFFVLTLRTYRAMETVVVFDLVGRLLKPNEETPDD